MATKKISVWYFGEEDVAEVKKFSKKISILFKLKGYEPDCDEFFDYFNIEDFFFIPCIQEGYEETEEDDYEKFEEDAIKALNSAYDSSVKISLADLEKYVKTDINETSVRDFLIDWIDRRGLESNDFVDFIEFCGLEIKQKFIDWLNN